MANLKVPVFVYMNDCGDGSHSFHVYPSLEALKKDNDALEGETFGEIKDWCDEDQYERGSVAKSVIEVTPDGKLAKPFYFNTDG